MSLFLCAYAREKLVTDYFFQPTLFMCVLNWMKESWKEHFLKGSKQSVKANGGKKPLFSSPVYIT